MANPVSPLRVAVVGVGRIGVFHARHVQELARESGGCELSAVADRFGDTAQRVAAQLQSDQEHPVEAHRDVEALAASGQADVAVIASRTEDHIRDARAFVDAGKRILLEKPISNDEEAAADFTSWLNADPQRATSVMLAFMRRFDAPLRHAKRLLDEGRIGTPFKVTSILEDNHPPPEGYQSPGLLPDMSVHNIDEIQWLLGRRPSSVLAAGANLHNYAVTTVKEDLDDGFLQLWFDGALGQVHVSRNHVAGYRNETRIMGDRGAIHVGHFQANPHRVVVEAHSPDGLLETHTHQLRDYGPDVPVFITRFGEAYKRELAEFLACCSAGDPFPVTHVDGYDAIAVARAAQRSVRTKGLPLGILLEGAS